MSICRSLELPKFHITTDNIFPVAIYALAFYAVFMVAMFGLIYCFMVQCVVLTLAWCYGIGGY